MSWRDNFANTVAGGVIAGVIAGMIVGFVEAQRDRVVVLRNFVWETRTELKADIERARKEAENAQNRIDFIERIQETD